MLSLPASLGHRIADLPKPTTYLQADEQLVAKWRERLAPLGGLQNRHRLARESEHGYRPIPQHPADNSLRRSPKSPASNSSVCSVDSGRSNWRRLNGRMEIQTLRRDLDTASGPFMDTAAVMKNLDLVITSDTAVAHLAGALRCAGRGWR